MSNQEDRFDFSDSENHGNQGKDTENPLKTRMIMARQMV